MMFFELLNNADNSAVEKKTILTYKADRVGAKTAEKSLLNLAKVYNDNSIMGMYADVTECGTVIYKDFLPCLEVATIYNDREAEKMLNTCRNFTEKVTDYVYYIENKIEAGAFIKNTELKLIELHGNFDLLQRAKQTKEDYLRAQEEQEKQEEARKEAERKAEQEARKIKFEKLIADYEQKIINKETFFNAEIETPEGKETTVILYLCQKYGLNIPLKTQGWINNGLAKIEWKNTEDKEITYSYYTTSRNSTVFFEYLKQLEFEILLEYSELTEEEKEEADKQKAEAEEEKSLYNSVEKIDFEAIKRTIEILENNDMHAYDRSEQHGEFVREIEFYSPEGEDVIETIFYDGTDEGFIKAFRSNAENFDADEHAEMWIEGRGKRGAPESVRDLITDAEWIKDTLLSVADELEGKHKGKNLYKCTITITDGEQTEEQDFYVEAYSFEEATENIKADLDI